MRSLSRKSQIPSTVFIYALAAIIIALILIFGYMAIGKLMTTSCETEKAKFKSDLKSVIEEDATYGKNTVIELSAPCNYEELCFVAKSEEGALSEDIKGRYPLAADVAESSDNVFLADIDGNIEPFEVGRFKIHGDAAYSPDLCVEEDMGEFRFRIKGEGDFALIVPIS